MALGSLEVQLSANIAKFQSDLGRAAKIAEDRMKEIDKSLGIVKTSLGVLGAGFLANATFDKIKEKIEGAISAAAGLKELSERTGASVEALSGLAAVAKLSGTDTEQLATGLQKLSKAMVDAQTGGTKTSAAFNAIGISTKDIANQKPEDVFLKVATQLDKFGDGANKTALAMALFGKAGANLLPVMKDLAVVGEYQTKVTEEQAEAALNYEKNLKRLEASTNLIYKKIGLELVPVLDAFTKALLDAQNGTNGVRDAVDGFAKDGSIREWATDAVKVVAFVIDAFQGVARIIEIVGNRLGSMAAQAVAVASGNFKQAIQIGKDFQDQADRILSAPLFSARLNAQLAKMNEKKKGEGESKPQVPFASALAAGNGNDVAKATMDAALKVLDAYIQAEHQLLQQRESMLDYFYKNDDLSIADYYAARANVMAEDLKNTIAAYDDEIAAVQKFIAQSTDAKEKILAQGKIVEIEKKRTAEVTAVGLKQIQNNFALAKSTQDYTDKVEQLNIRLLELQGNFVEASARQEALQNRQVRKLFETNGNTAALDTLDQLEKIAATKAAINQQDEMSSLMQQRLSTAEGRIALEQATGSKTELQGLIATGDARRKAAVELSATADEYERIAQASGDPRLIANAEAFRLKVDEIAASADTLGKKFNEVLSGPLDTFFTDLMSGTKSVSSAFRDMAKSIVKEIDNIVAAELRSRLLSSLGIGTGGTSGGFGGFLSSLFGGSSAASGGEAMTSAGSSLASLGLAGGFANGTSSFGGGLRLVGEHGPEMEATGPSRIFDAAQTAGILRDASAPSSNTQTNVININNTFPANTSRQSVQQAATQMGQQVNRAIRRNG